MSDRLIALIFLVAGLLVLFGNPRWLSGLGKSLKGDKGGPGSQDGEANAPLP